MAKYKIKERSKYMQQSFIITFPFEKASLNKPIEDLLVLPENTIGAYIIRKIGNMRRISIHIPRVSYERSLMLVSKDSNGFAGDISFFNFVCSLQKCAVKMNVLPTSDPNVNELTIEAIAYGEDVRFIKTNREKLNQLNS